MDQVSAILGFDPEPHIVDRGKPHHLDVVKSYLFIYIYIYIYIYIFKNM